MPWYNGDYPPSYKNQPDFLREKAVEIANALLSEGVEEGIAIATGLKRAKQFFNAAGQADNEDNGLYEIEDDRETMEPGDFGTNDGTIDSSDSGQLKFWADQFQISIDELKAAVALRGSDISEIKKYLKT